MAKQRRGPSTKKATDRVPNSVGVKADGTVNQAVRVVIILRYLHLNHKGVTINELVEMLFNDHEIDVDKRQIQRDVKYIKMGGIDLTETRNVREVTYSIPSEQRVQHVSTMTQAVPLALDLIKAFVPQAAKVDLEKLEGRINQILKKDSASLIGSEEDVMASSDLMHSIHSGTWKRDVDPTILAETFAAVKKRRWHEITYGSDVAVPVVVFPCKLTLYLGRMYMIAYRLDKEEYFVYPLDRIFALELEQGPRRARHEFDPDRFMKTRWGIWSSIKNPGNPSNIYKVEVLVVGEESEKHLIREFVHRKWHPTQDVKKIDDLQYKMTFECGVSPELVSWVLRWAPHVQIVKPKFLKDQVRERAERLMKTL